MNIHECECGCECVRVSGSFHMPQMPAQPKIKSPDYLQHTWTDQINANED